MEDARFDFQRLQRQFSRVKSEGRNIIGILVSGFEFRSFSFQFSGSEPGFRFLGSMFRAPCFRDSGFVFCFSCSEFQVQDFGFRIPGSGFWVH